MILCLTSNSARKEICTFNIVNTSHLILLHFLEPIFFSIGWSLALTRESLNFLALRKDPIGVGVNTALTSKAICRYLESSLIFLAKNVSLGWNVTTKGTPLVESSRVLFFQLTYPFHLFFNHFFGYPSFSNVEFLYKRRAWLYTIDFFMCSGWEDW